MRLASPALLLALGLAAGPAQSRPEVRPDFWAGADLSYVNEMQDCGAVYRKAGRERDPFELFAESGHNLVRVRLWNDATWTRYSNLADVKKTIRRAKAAGMSVLLDFHYSDDWADGDKQIVPAAWRPIRDDVPALSKAVADYTRSVLTDLAAEGLAPEMIQIGNETNPEVMGEADWKTTRPRIDWARNAALLNAGLKAAREASAAWPVRPRLMLHIAQPENVEPWFAAAAAHGVTDYDLIGISYYRKWSSESPKGLTDTIRRLRKLYPEAGVVVVETAYPFTTDWADDSPNLLGADSLLKGYAATPEGQRAYAVDLANAVKAAGGEGLVWWEPAWVSTRCSTRWGVGSNWENATFFDWRKGNEATPALDWPRAIRP